MKEEMGAPLAGQALAVPAKPASGLDAARFDPSRIREIANKCELTSIIHREIDAMVFNAASDDAMTFNRTALKLPLHKFRSRFDDGWVVVDANKGEDDPYPNDLPAYTKSIDAAMTLVPRDHAVSLETAAGTLLVYASVWHDVPEYDGASTNEARAWTSAAAICAAALRARAAIAMEAAKPSRRETGSTEGDSAGPKDIARRINP